MKLSILTSIIFLFYMNTIANTEVRPNQYKIESEVYVGGKLVSKPKIIALENESASISQVGEDYKVALTQTIIKNNGDFGDADVIVKSKLEVVEGDSQRITTSTRALTFGGKKESVFSFLKTSGNDNTQDKTNIEVKSKVIKL